MTSADAAVQQYFQTVRAAFTGLEVYLDDVTRNNPPARDLTASLIMKYVERLMTSLR